MPYLLSSSPAGTVVAIFHLPSIGLYQIEDESWIIKQTKLTRNNQQSDYCHRHRRHHHHHHHHHINHESPMIKQHIGSCVINLQFELNNHLFSSRSLTNDSTNHTSQISNYSSPFCRHKSHFGQYQRQIQRTRPTSLCAVEWSMGHDIAWNVCWQIRAVLAFRIYIWTIITYISIQRKIRQSTWHMILPAQPYRQAMALHFVHCWYPSLGLLSLLRFFQSCRNSGKTWHAYCTMFLLRQGYCGLGTILSSGIHGELKFRWSVGEFLPLFLSS